MDSKMFRRPNESFLEYKARVIDSKSKSFCGAKWYNATIWLGSGMTASCHHPPAHKVGLDEVKLNYKAIHNTLHKKEMRQLMQHGERPAECEYCWKIEDLNKQNVSDRVFKTEIYSDEDLSLAYQAPWTEDINLKTLEIAFDRNCNFACSYCNPSFSSKWAADIVKNGGYKNLVSDGASHFTSSAPEAEPFSGPDANPYIDAFWKWWPELSQTLQEIRITGGEPLINKNTWKFFDFFESNNLESNLALAINSNLGSDDTYIAKLIEKSQFVKKLRLFTSCEAHGVQAEYIRDGLNYAKWKSNLNRILREGRVESCNIMMTINALCLFSIVEFLNDIVEIKSKFPVGKLHLSVNILRFPSFQNVLVLPFSIRAQVSAKLVDWIGQNRESNLLTDFEIESLIRLTDYLLNESSVPHHRSSELKMRQSDFKNFYLQYDQRRSKNFEETFPDELTNWFRSL